MKKKSILTTALVVSGIIFFLSLIEFKNPIEAPGNIEQNFFVLAVGIDKGLENEENFRLTVLAEKFSADIGDSSSPQAKKADEITVEGKTIFEAVRKFHLSNGKILFWGHIKYILISEDIAKENILDVLDFFVRDHELRFNTNLAVIKGASAEATIRLGEKIERFIPDLLDGLFHSVGKNSISEEITLLEFMRQIDLIGSEPCLPSIEILSRHKDIIEVGDSEEGSDSKEGSDSEEGSDSKEECDSEEGSDSEEESNSKKGSDSEEGSDSKEGSVMIKSSSSQEKDTLSKEEQIYLALDGFATFNREKLVGYLSGYKARGLNWIRGKIESGTIVLQDDKGKKTSLEIMSANSKIKTILNRGKPEALIEIRFYTNINEIMSQRDIFNKLEIAEITKKQNDLVKKEIESVIEYAQKNKIDILNLSDKVSYKYPSEWEVIKENWNEIFEKMRIEVSVKSEVRTTYHIREPIMEESGENK